MWGQIMLKDYRDEPTLPSEFLAQLQVGFDIAQKAGLKVIIRGSYGHVGLGGDYKTFKDPDENIIKRHIEQLAPLFEKNKHLIAFFEAGFIGPWGEWHSTHITKTPSLQREFFFHILNHTPKNRMVLLRYPELKRSIFKRRKPLSAELAYDESHLSRSGHHNDCFLSSSNDVGTYNRGDSNRAEETNYLAEETLHTLFGGETCKLHSFNDAERTLIELEILHASYLNQGYHPDVLNKWKVQNCYDEIERRLGARFVVRTIKILPEKITIEIENTGFASLYNERPVYLALESKAGHATSILLEQDPRTWKPGQISSFTVSVKVQEVAKIGLHLPDASKQLASDPNYAYRLANQDAWDPQTGINWLWALSN